MIDPLTASGVELSRAIHRREISSLDVVGAHVERCRSTAERINAIAVERFEEAIAEAVRADERISAAGPGDELPLYLGVPCTIKESIGVAGMPNCAGVVARRDYLCEETAPAAQRLLDSGAIPLGLTNTSELTLWVESANRVYGRTNNAYDPRRTAGGSSGGEGAVIGSGGSPFGLGSDIGGSIRTPSFFGGIFGHKPTPGVVPNTGTYPAGQAGELELLGMGPMTRRAEDLMPLLRLLAGPDGVDPSTREVELGDPASVQLEGLRVLTSESFSTWPVSRELSAARVRAAEALAAVGAKVETVEMKGLRRAYELYVITLNRASPTTARGLLTEAGSKPLRLSGLASRRSPHTYPTRMLIALESAARLIPERTMRRMLAAGRALRQEIIATIGEGVLLHPPHSRVAPRHNSILRRARGLAPVFIFNLAGTPATQVPLGLNKRGLPLGVQVVAGPDRDHLSIAVAIELERALGGWVPPASPA